MATPQKKRKTEIRKYGKYVIRKLRNTKKRNVRTTEKRNVRIMEKRNVRRTENVTYVRKTENETERNGTSKDKGNAVPNSSDRQAFQIQGVLVWNH